ncbi:MAG: aminoacetone oxidase family FAD-binding enzyme [Acetobacter sp.]|nr:aminoacetone oxidase family FAD-binding enzyme [Bacteroides sp.]MCM1340914.1 aminoacetone oxidase family FAD-binding enzyme [Acetobacter sp.]MCM1432530.1 aminoacetone oxidase family FAD-binding enzyme [Clostridiales bacterium]
MTTIIIGAGASGLACAIRLKQNNPDSDITIIERLGQAGKKILATGNGRCNLTNTASPYYNDVKDFFNNLGLITRIDDEGRVYPYSNQSSTVVDLLTEKCFQLGIEIITECIVKNIDNDLCAETDKGIYMADNIVIATGGKAQKALGSDGSGYNLLKSLGHTITPVFPALVQITSSSKYPRALKGHRVHCNMSILIDNKCVGSETGEVLFADYGLSGIVTMNLSRFVSRNFADKKPKKCHAVLDLIPDMSEHEVYEYLKKFKNLKGILGIKLADIIYKQADGDCTNQSRYAKNWKLIITGTKGFDFAQISSGGADTNEFDGFRSKFNSNVYACGEVLDRQFDCGGFNLSFAWYSGIKTADQISDANTNI